MAINITVKETEVSEPIKEGMYDALVKEIDEGTGTFGDYLKISFEITAGEFKGVLKSSVASKKLSKSKSGKKSKLFEIVTAITGIAPEAGESLDIEKLIGKSCKILVKNGQEKDGITFQNVTEVMPS